MSTETSLLSFIPGPRPPTRPIEETLGPPYAAKAAGDAIETQLEHVSLLVEVNSVLTGALEPESALEKILSRLTERERLGYARIYRLDEALGELQCIASAGCSGRASPAISLKEAGFLSLAARSGESVYIPLMGMDTFVKEKEYGGRGHCVYAVPLRTRTRVLGVLEVASLPPDGIRAVTCKLIDQFSLQVALALESNELHTRLRFLEEERDRLQQQLYQAQKMEALGTLAGGIAHDLNNLLSVMLGFASLARQRLKADDPLQDSMGMIEQSAQRAAELTRQLLVFARPERARIRPVCVNEVLNRVTSMVTRTFDRKIKVALQNAAESMWVQAEPSYLEQALLNLCINSRDAMPEGGTLSLQVQAFSAPHAELPPDCRPGAYAAISVRDTGAGITPEILPRVFEPFFTTKEPGRGTGLGLAMVSSFIKNHHGFVTVKSAPAQGAAFTMALPLIPAPLPAEAPGTVARLPAGKGCILVVDDEPLVRAFAEQGLQGMGYQVLVAENGRQAQEIYRQHSEEISCVLLDLIMPDLSGLEIFRQLRAINPKVRVVFASGYSTGEFLRNAPEARSEVFIGKPYTLAGLSHAVRKASLGGPH